MQILHIPKKVALHHLLGDNLYALRTSCLINCLYTPGALGHVKQCDLWWEPGGYAVISWTSEGAGA